MWKLDFFQCQLISLPECALTSFMYFSPEVLKSEPYGEKADVWAAGCILYQMATLSPPFCSTNMLSLATKVSHREQKGLR